MRKLNDQLRLIDVESVSNMVCNVKPPLNSAYFALEQSWRSDALFKDAYSYLNMSEERITVFIADTSGAYPNEVASMRKCIRIVRKGIEILEQGEIK